MEAFGIFQRDVVAFALGGVHVEQDGLLGIFGEVKVVLNLFKIMPVDGSDIADAVFFKEGGGDKEILGFLFPFDAKVDDCLSAGNFLRKASILSLRRLYIGIVMRSLK